jgi:hypothetical protein
MLTPEQRGSLHVWCDDIAKALNEAGYDFNDGLVIQMPVSFTKENVKESMVKRVMISLYPDLESTEKMEPKQVMEVQENLIRFIAERTGVVLPPWPCNESRHD